jgi:hypothetical protein
LYILGSGGGVQKTEGMQESLERREKRKGRNVESREKNGGGRQKKETVLVEGEQQRRDRGKKEMIARLPLLPLPLVVPFGFVFDSFLWCSLSFGSFLRCFPLTPSPFFRPIIKRHHIIIYHLPTLPYSHNFLLFPSFASSLLLQAGSATGNLPGVATPRG